MIKSTINEFNRHLLLLSFPSHAALGNKFSFLNFHKSLSISYFLAQSFISNSHFTAYYFTQFQLQFLLWLKDTVLCSHFVHKNMFKSTTFTSYFLGSILYELPFDKNLSSPKLFVLELFFNSSNGRALKNKHK